MSSTTVAGGLRPAAAAELGLAVGTPVVLGGGDGPIASVGVGSLGPQDDAYISLGSSAWLATASEQPLQDPLPIWVGGGISHGPQPRDYSQRTPKKMIAAALRGALSDRARDGQVHIISEIVTGETPSTKAALATLSTIADLNKVLVVLDRYEDIAWLSLRNVPQVHALAVDQLNTYDVLVNDAVIFTSAALDTFIGGHGSFGVEAVATESEAVELASTETQEDDK